MAITQAFCTSAKVSFFKGELTPLADTLKMALYASTATLSAATTVYTTTGEITGTGYSAGGLVLVNVAITSSGTTAWLTFDSPVWPGSTFTARGALIYDVTRANKAIAVLDFGADKTVTNRPFTVNMPVASATTSLIRIE